MPITDPEKIILGCGNFGGIGSLPEFIGHGENKEQAFTILNLAKMLGIKKFDTANTYGGGLSEEYLGEWLATQSGEYRNSIQIHTKVGNPNATMPGKNPLSQEEIASQVDTSLKRLKTNYIDLYYIHEPDPKTPLEETVEALLKYVNNGKIYRLGLSNVSLEYVQRFVTVLGIENTCHLFCIQNEFNYLKQEDSRALIPYLKKNNIKYAAYSPLAGGLLSGKYNFQKPFPPGSRMSLRSGPYQTLLTLEVFDEIENLKTKAKNHNRLVSEEAIQFLIGNDLADFIVIGPRRKEHYENLGFQFN